MQACHSCYFVGEDEAGGAGWLWIQAMLKGGLLLANWLFSQFFVADPLSPQPVVSGCATF